MTREEIAVAAMQGLLMHGRYFVLTKNADDNDVVRMAIAAEAYEIADAMLAERELSADQLRERDGK